jgi:ribose transport system ATP-binding protein
MVGRELSSFHPHSPQTPRETVLRIESLRTMDFPHHAVSLELRRHEIVGLAGLVGAGRSELLTAIFGLAAPVSGSVLLNGQPMARHQCRQAIAAGMALVPEDRKAQGVILEMSLRENLSLAQLAQLTRLGPLIHHPREHAAARAQSRALQIKSSSIEQAVQLLSGGNQQKVVIGKWLNCNPSVLLMDEPTRGVDVGAKQEIYRLMHDLAVSGAAILFASSDLEEILSMADRILVMHEGRLMGELRREEFSEQAVMKLATGLVE